MSEKTNNNQSELGGIKALSEFKAKRIAPVIEQAKEVKSKLSGLTQSLLDIKSEKLAILEQARALAEQKQAVEAAQVNVKVIEPIKEVKVEPIPEPKKVEVVIEKPIATATVVAPEVVATPKKEETVVVAKEIVEVADKTPQENIQTRIFDNTPKKENRPPRDGQPRPQGADYQGNQPRPPQQGGYQNNPRPQGAGYQGNNPRPQGAGYQGNNPRPQGAGYQGNNPRPQGAGYQGNNPRPQGAGYQGNNPRPQGAGYQGNNPRPQGAGYQGNNPRPQGAGYQGNNPRPQGAGYQGNNPRPQGAGYQGGQSRPQQSSGGKFGFTAAAPIIPQPTKNFANKTGIKKSPAQQQMEDRKSQNKRALIRKGFIVTDPIIIDEDGSETSRHLKRRPKKNEFIQPTSTKIENAVVTAGIIPIKLLSEKIGKTGGEILKQLMLLGILKTINDVIDFDTADLVAGEFGVKLTYEPEKTAEDILDDIEKVSDIDDGDNYCTRPPVVTIMGHVDHGKTSLLDCIRKTNVTQGEAGGITQHIGAYTVSLNNKPITFLDTPGHEAFTAMRMRGAQVTDIAIIVVAADDGVMPQTIEAINHAKQAGVSIIIAVNKIDKPAAQPEKVLQKLTEYGIVPEEWGGETPVVYVSAKTGENVNKLLETILLVAEILDLKANADRQARGSIIEARLDKGKGPLATVLVQNGTLHVGDFVVAGICVGKIRAMIDDKGRATKVAGPSIPVSVLGFSEVPNAGDPIMVVQDEKLAKQVATERQQKIRIDMNIAKPTASLEDIFAQIQKGVTKSLNIIIKADVQGSVEAVKQSIVKLSNDEVKIVVIHGAVGAINESDVMLANTSGSIIIGFNVRADVNAKANAERDNIDIRLYRIIYDAIDDVEKAIKGMLAPKFKEVSLGNAEIRQVYKITGVGSIAGAYVTDGKIIRTAKIRLYRDNTFIFEGELNSLKRFKDDVKEVAKGYECGMGITNYNDIKEGDVIEAFTMEQIND